MTKNDKNEEETTEASGVKDTSAKVGAKEHAGLDQDGQAKPRGMSPTRKPEAKKPEADGMKQPPGSVTPGPTPNMAHASGLDQDRQGETQGLSSNENEETATTVARESGHLSPKKMTAPHGRNQWEEEQEDKKPNAKGPSAMETVRTVEEICFSDLQAKQHAKGCGVPMKTLSAVNTTVEENRTADLQAKQDANNGPGVPMNPSAVAGADQSTGKATGMAGDGDRLLTIEELNQDIEVGATKSMPPPTQTRLRRADPNHVTRTRNLFPGAYHLPGPNVTDTSTTGSQIIHDAQEAASDASADAHHGLVEALPVQDVPKPVGFAQEIDPELLARNAKDKHHRWFILAILVVCVAIVLGLVVGLKNSTTTAAADSTLPVTVTLSMSPTGAPSSAPTGALDLLLMDLPNSTQANIQIFGTPQWQAYHWLLRHRNITNLPEWKMKQLFALATFFYAFEGENWWNPIQDKWMDDTVDECLWFSSSFGYFKTWVEGEPYADRRPADQVSPCNNETGEFVILHLEDLRLGGLEPVVPPEIALLTSLTELKLQRSDINTTLLDILPAELDQMTTLLHIDFGYNDLHGPLPSELGFLTSIPGLSLQGNSLSGLLPTELGLLTSTTKLWLESNSFSGALPSELGLMTSMTWLEFDGNSFSASLPSEIGSLTSVEYFSLYDNSLSGFLPTEMGLMTSMTRLALYANSFSGILPTELVQLSNLHSIFLRDNYFSGSLPSELGLMTWLRDLSLGRNSLSGSLPTELGLMTSLTGLVLGNNQLSGPLPSEVGLLTFDVLWLQNNFLSGDIPAQLNASNTDLDLSENQFSGIVPPHLCPVLGCDCQDNASQVDTCLYLDKEPEWPGRFPLLEDADDDSVPIMINIKTDPWPHETEWTWQKRNETSGWNIVEQSDGALQRENSLYSYQVAVTPNNIYMLSVTDANPDGLADPGYVTLTSNRYGMSLFSFEDRDPFVELAAEVQVDMHGSLEVQWFVTL